MPADPAFTTRQLAPAVGLSKDKINNAYKLGVVAPSLIPEAPGGSAGRPLRHTEAMAIVLGLRLFDCGLSAAWVAVAVEKEMRRVMKDDAVFLVMAAEDGTRVVIGREKDGSLDLSLDYFNDHPSLRGKTLVFAPLEKIRKSIKEIVPAPPRSKGGWGSGKDAYEKAMAEYRGREGNKQKVPA